MTSNLPNVPLPARPSPASASPVTRPAAPPVASPAASSRPVPQATSQPRSVLPQPTTQAPATDLDTAWGTAPANPVTPETRAAEWPVWLVNPGFDPRRPIGRFYELLIRHPSITYYAPIPADELLCEVNRLRRPLRLRQAKHIGDGLMLLPQCSNSYLVVTQGTRLAAVTLIVDPGDYADIDDPADMQALQGAAASGQASRDVIDIAEQTDYTYETMNRTAMFPTPEGTAAITEFADYLRSADVAMAWESSGFADLRTPGQSEQGLVSWSAKQAASDSSGWRRVLDGTFEQTFASSGGTRYTVRVQHANFGEGHDGMYFVLALADAQAARLADFLASFGSKWYAAGKVDGRVSLTRKVPMVVSSTDLNRLAGQMVDDFDLWLREHPAANPDSNGMFAPSASPMASVPVDIVGGTGTAGVLHATKLAGGNLACPRCGAPSSIGVKFCSRCGAAIVEGATAAESANPAPARPQPAPRVDPASVDPVGSFGWAVLGFFIPIVGLVLWLVWKDDRPGDSRRARNGFIAGLVFAVVMLVIRILIVATMLPGTYYL